MKGKKIIFAVTLDFSLLLAGTGCEKKQTFEIFENRVIDCCGVINPIENLEWLNEVIKTDTPHYSSYSVELFVNNIDETQFIVTKDPIFTSVYSCNGNRLFGGHYIGETNFQQEEHTFQSVSPEPCEECEDFYKTHHLIGVIYEKKIVE